MQDPRAPGLSDEEADRQRARPVQDTDVTNHAVVLEVVDDGWSGYV